jgi:hypothetical protein
MLDVCDGLMSKQSPTARGALGTMKSRGKLAAAITAEAQAEAGMTMQAVSTSVWAPSHLGWHEPADGQAALLVQLQRVTSHMPTQGVSNSALARLLDRAGMCPAKAQAALPMHLQRVASSMIPQAVSNSAVGLEIARRNCALTGGGAAATGLALGAEVVEAQAPTA